MPFCTFRRAVLWIAAPVLGFAAAPTLACLNDRDSDTFAQQAQQFPKTLQVITGRFDRNPSLYFEMRIKRSTAELRQNPKRFGLYDDIAVAFDRLGRDKEAMAWMARKRSALPSYDASQPDVKEAWYRYYANDGTFRAHNWLHAGGKKDRMAEMRQARAEIARAIEIKPDAHFGRERYQLMTMDWIIAHKTAKTKDDLADYLSKKDNWEDGELGITTRNGEVSNRRRAVEGLSGLIVLGAAWQSPDVFAALAEALKTGDTITLYYMALLRSRELLSQGKKSQGSLTLERVDELRSLAEYAGVGAKVNKKNQQSLDGLFTKLRLEADTWQASRARFMMDKMRRGQHPDTSTAFWKGYLAAPPPNLELPWYEGYGKNYRLRQPGVGSARFSAIAILVGAALFSLVLLRFARKRRQGTSRRTASAS